MNLSDFNQYNHEQRLALIYEQGKFLAVRGSGHCSLYLYSVGNFFAEIWYRVADNEIQLVRSFQSTSCLESYLAMVDLSELNV